MSQSFSTDQVPVSDRLDAWQYNASQLSVVNWPAWS